MRAHTVDVMESVVHGRSRTRQQNCGIVSGWSYLKLLNMSAGDVFILIVYLPLFDKLMCDQLKSLKLDFQLRPVCRMVANKF